MSRYLLQCCYLGTRFHGWQIQPNASSIQGEIETALQTVLGQQVGIMGSSRTDTGVHARQQFAHFDFETPIVLNKLTHSLNGIISRDISVIDIREVHSGFHSRFDATHRKYIYRLIQHKDPFHQHISTIFRGDFAQEKIKNACEILLQHKDYQSFSKYHTDVNNFDCSIAEARWVETNYGWEFHIKANRFLRGMVRAIVGTMMDLVMDKISLEQFNEILLKKDRIYAGKSAPAKGLTLEEVGYDHL